MPKPIKYINTPDVAKRTGRPYNKILELVKSGVLPSHKTHSGHYRLNVDAVEAYFGIQINKPEEEACSKLQVKNEERRVKSKAKITQLPKMESEIVYIADEEHISQVFRRMAEVQHSLKIATANLKNFSVTVEGQRGSQKMRLCEFFMSLVERGVRVQIVCMKPVLFYLYAKEHCPRLLEHPLFDLRLNEHNHMKIFIFDDECAYLGSANITDAAIGKCARRRRNHEAGMLMQGKMMQHAQDHFERVWTDPDNIKHTWKRFATEAKKLEKTLSLRYGT